MSVVKYVDWVETVLRAAVKAKAEAGEVERDGSNVPYRVKQRLARQKRVIDVGDVFVRHGSRVVAADADELADLETESERARRHVLDRPTGPP